VATAQPGYDQHEARWRRPAREAAGASAERASASSPASAPGSPEALRGHARTIAEAARGTYVPLGELAPGLLAELLEERV
jgi:hypothetical protein